MKKYLGLVIAGALIVSAAVKAADGWVTKPVGRLPFSPYLTIQHSTPLSTAAGYVRLTAVDASAWITFASSGATGTIAGNASTAVYLPPERPEIFKVSPNSRISVVAGASTGFLNIIEVTQ